MGVGSFWLRNYGRLGLFLFFEENVDPSVENRGNWKAGSGKAESGSMSYASVVRKNEGLAEEATWL